MAIEGVNGYSTPMTSSAGSVERKVQEAAKTGAGVSAEKDDQPVQKENSSSGQANHEKYLESAVSAANQKIRMTNTRCEFQYHEKTHRVSIKVIDTDKEEVIREIPPEETLEMVEKLWELAGLIVDERR